MDEHLQVYARASLFLGDMKLFFVVLIKKSWKWKWHWTSHMFKFEVIILPLNQSVKLNKLIVREICSFIPGITKLNHHFFRTGSVFIGRLNLQNGFNSFSVWLLVMLCYDDKSFQPWNTNHSAIDPVEHQPAHHHRTFNPPPARRLPSPPIRLPCSWCTTDSVW